MKTLYFRAALVFFTAQFCSLFCSVNTHAQSLFYGTTIVPSNPSSLDNITFVRVVPGNYCFRFSPSYKISMQNNDITVTFADWDLPPLVTLPPPDGRYSDLVSLGRLPPGNYTLTTEGLPCPFAYPSSHTELKNFAFKVSAAKTKKSDFNALLDYSGHWWDENDPGWGLFIWQDAANTTLAAWLTYTSDGKPTWYVFQPIWVGDNSTSAVDLMQTNKPPSAVLPLTGATKLTRVGFAALSFYFGNYNRGGNLPSVEEFGRFFYQLDDGARITRTLTRFKAK